MCVYRSLEGNDRFFGGDGFANFRRDSEEGAVAVGGWGARRGGRGGRVAL